MYTHWNNAYDEDLETEREMEYTGCVSEGQRSDWYSPQMRAVTMSVNGRRDRAV